MTGGRLRRVVKVALLGLGSSVQCPRWEAGTGCTGHQEVGLPLGWRDLGWGWQGKRGSLLGAVCLWVEARAEVSSEIRWGVGCLSRRVVWKLL